MTDSQEWIFAERNSSSDTDIAINEVFVVSGDLVKHGEVLFELEGAKAVFEVESPRSGYFYTSVNQDDRVSVNAPIALISDTQLSEIPLFNDHNSPREAENNPASATTHEPSGVQATKAAILLAQELNFDLNELQHLELITKEAVLGALSAGAVETKWATNPKIKLAVLGGGPHATLISEIASSDPSIILMGVFDDERNLLSDLGVPLLGPIEEQLIQKLYFDNHFTHMAIGVGANMPFRKRWVEFCNAHSIPLATLVHERAVISKSALIGEGALVMDTARIGPHAVLGTNVFVSAGTNIEHHCFVGDNTTFGPGVQLSGGVTIGERCGFGTQVGIEPGISIGDDCQISSGSIITSNVPSGTTVKSSGKRIDR